MQSILNSRIAHRAARIVRLLLALSMISSPGWAAPTTRIQGPVQSPAGSAASGSITITWPAFTTANNEAVAAGRVAARIGADGQVALDLAPNAGAQPAGSYYTAEYQLKNGSSRSEHWVVPARPRVTLAEVRVEEPTAAPSANEQQAPQADVQQRSPAADHHAEIQQFGVQGEKPRSQGPPKTHYTDTRPDYRGDFFHDPDRNPFSNTNDSWLQVCNYTSQPGFTGGSKGWNRVSNNCMNQYEFNAVPGIDLGNPKVGPGGWSTHAGVVINSTVNSPGISEILTGNQVKAGIGDNVGFYFYNVNYGGTVAASDEGNHLMAALGGEQSTVYTGNVTKGGTGATALKVKCTADCQYPGDGRYLIDTQQPVAAGHVTGMARPQGNLTPGTFTTDVNVTPSSAWGTLAADVVTPVATEIGTGFTTMTFDVNVTHGRFSPGSLVCFGGQFHEQALVSSVNGNSLTIPLRHAHEAGSWIMQGGPCGSFIEFTANSVTPEKQKIRYPVDILGATDSHTLVYRYFAYASGTFSGGYWPGNVTFLRLPARNLTNSDGVVTFTPTAGNQAQHPELYNAASIYISNAANPRFNGACTNTKLTSSGQLSCTQNSSNGATSATAEVSYGASISGNTEFNLWAGAEVLDVLDHSVSPPAVNGTFTLEPNGAAWSANDSVENVHHYATHVDAQRLVLTDNNPMKLTSLGRELQLHGAGISGGNPAISYAYSSDKIINFQPGSTYAYHGGTVTPPGGIYFGGGLFNFGLAMQYAPDPPGSSMFYIGCPLSGCDDSGFYYSFFSLQGNGGSSTFNYTPATNTLSLSGKGLNLRNEPLIGTTLQSEHSGGSASLKFNAIDSSGQPHMWALNAPPSGEGATINLPQSSGTLALNDAFGASGPSHSAGMVPDPGPNRGATRFLREDGKWVEICRDQAAASNASFRPAVLSRSLRAEEPAAPPQPKFPAVVAHASLDAQTGSLHNLLGYVPESEGTFRVTVSVFIESPCDAGTLSVESQIYPIAGHNAGQAQNRDCTTAYSNITSTVTAHGAAGVPIDAAVGFQQVQAGGLRYMVDAVLEQLQ